MGIPRRHANQSHDDHGNFDSQLHHFLVPVTSTDYLPSFIHFAGVECIKFGTCSICNQSSYNLLVLREIPTRIPQKTSPHNVIDALINDNGADARSTTMTKMLPPTTLEGPAAPLPYPLELAAITAAIDRMKQCNAENPINPNNLPYVISDTQHVELSAALTKLEKNRLVSPQQAEVSPPKALPLPLQPWLTGCLTMATGRNSVKLMAELYLPVEPPRPNAMEPSNQIPTATQALCNFLTQYPRPIDCTDDDNGNHLHDEHWQSSSLMAMLQLQMKVVPTLNVLCVKLSDTLDLILATIQCNSLSPHLISPPNTLLTPPTTQPAKTNIDQSMHATDPSQTYIPPWLQCHTDPCNKPAPVLKFTPYKKPIPAKPTFTCRRRHMAIT